jgi:hypothetical protein
VLLDSGYQVADNVPYGDPGLLVPGFYSPSPNRVDDFCVIPHHAHYREWREKLRGMNVIDLNLSSYEGLQGIIWEISKYRAVFSASLHATILAESFGIPTRPIAPTLPFKFDDFYASVAKPVEYIPEMRRDLDWGKLYEETVGEWRPGIWNPEPWLDASPFKIDDSLRRRLSDHYARLAESKEPAPASLSSSTLAAYRLIAADKATPEPSRKGVDDNESAPDQRTETCLLCEDFRKAPDKWTLTIDGTHVHFFGDCEPALITENGCELRVKSGGVHLITDYVEASQALEVRARIEFSAAEGLAELSLQDEEFRTVAHVLSGLEDGDRSLEMTFWPVSPNSRVRLVVSPLRGRLVIRRIRISGLTEPTDDSPSGAEPEATPVPTE